MNNDLPVLNSERKEFEYKLREERNRADANWHAALRMVNRIIMEDKFLTNEDKTRLLEAIWRK